jgi:signal transduction histidine kinase
MQRLHLLTRLATLVCLLVLAAQAEAQAPFALESLRTRASLTEHVGWLEDPDGTLELAQVRGRAFHAADDGLVFGFTRTAYWLKLSVTGARDDAWLLELAYPNLDEVDLYAVHPDGRVDHVAAGNEHGFAARPVEHATYVFPLHTPAGEALQLYLRVRTDGTVIMPLEAWRMAAFVGHASNRHALLWLFWGGIVVMAGFNLGVAALLRNGEYLYGALMLLAQGFLVFTLSGETYHNLVPSHPLLAAHSHAFSYVLTALTILLYARSVMRQLATPPSSLRAVEWMTLGALIVLPLASFAPVDLAVRGALAYTLAMAVFAMYVLHTLRPYPELRFHRLAFYVLFMAFPLAVMAYGNLITPHPIAMWAAHLGYGLHGVLTSLALPQRIREMAVRVARLNGLLQANVIELEGALSRAEQATKVKDQFMANMSHELRTPLNAIINVPEGLRRDFGPVEGARCTRCAAEYELDASDSLATPCAECGGSLAAHTLTVYRGDPARTQQFLHKIERSGKHLLRMVDDVLDFSKLEAGKLELHPVAVDLAALLRDTADELSELGARKQVRIELDLPVRAASIEADPVRIKQVVINLLSNAIKFTAPDTRVLVRHEQGDEHDVISVIDQGIGIAPEDHQRIFESFEQVHQPGQKYGGTGLGLSISRALARAHGGELWVESERGAGARFHVRVPRLQGQGGPSMR